MKIHIENSKLLYLLQGDNPLLESSRRRIRFEGELYSLGRMVQYLGLSLLFVTYRCSRFSSYFGDSDMIFFDSAADLGEQIEPAVAEFLRSDFCDAGTGAHLVNRSIESGKMNVLRLAAMQN